MSAPTASTTTTKPRSERSVAWQVVHWVVAISPFALVLALSVWGYGRYVWVPLVAAIACPVGAALVGLQLKRDRARSKPQPR